MSMLVGSERDQTWGLYLAKTKKDLVYGLTYQALITHIYCVLTILLGFTFKKKNQALKLHSFFFFLPKSESELFLCWNSLIWGGGILHGDMSVFPTQINQDLIFLLFGENQLVFHMNPSSITSLTCGIRCFRGVGDQ